jgi:flagellar protein FlbD
MTNALYGDTASDPEFGMPRAFAGKCDPLSFVPLPRNNPPHQSFRRRADKPIRTQEGFLAMIELTRLNGQVMVVNSDLIKYVESSPDTMLTLIHGEKIVVSEPCDEVVRRITTYRAMLIANVLRYIPGDEATSLTGVAAAASSLRAAAAEQGIHSGELPDESEEPALLRRRRHDQ